MSKLYQSRASCSPSQQDNSYIYAVIPTVEHGLAAITSADELILLDRCDLSHSPVLRLSDVPRNVSGLVSGNDSGSAVLCSGGDGSVVTFDIRSQDRVSHFKTDKAVTALACKDNHIAIGTEFANHQAIVSAWDRRQNRQVWQNAENSDDITALDFHPSRSNILLAGGDDGQGVNHGPVHKAGFLGSDRFFALSSDQNLSVYPLSGPDDNEDPPPIVLGDLRSVVPCEYIINIFRSGDGYAVAAGSNNNDSRVDIIELRHATNPGKEPKLKLKSGYTLAGAHGEEIVRSVFADDTMGVIFTAGEDGQVKAFGPSDNTAQPSDSSKSSSKVKRGSEGRYKPY